MKPFLVSALLLVAFAPGALAQPYNGRYRPDEPWAEGWDCISIGKDGGALAIANHAFFGVESQCALQNPTVVRDMDATLFDMMCSAEGETSTERVLIMSRPGGIAMIRRGADISLLRRCE